MILQFAKNVYRHFNFQVKDVFVEKEDILTYQQRDVLIVIQHVNIVMGHYKTIVFSVVEVQIIDF